MVWSWKSLQHGRWRSDLPAYIDGEIEASRAARLEAHLATCERCREELAYLRATKGLLLQLPQIQAPRSFALLYAPSSQPERTAPAWFGALRGATIAAIAGLAVLLAVDFVSVELSGMSGEEESASFQVPAAQQSTAESATSGAAQDAMTPTSGNEGALELSPTQDAGEDERAFEPLATEDADETRERDFRLRSEDASSNDDWSALRIAEIALGASALLLATGWIITARRRQRQA